MIWAGVSGSVVGEAGLWSSLGGSAMLLSRGAAQNSIARRRSHILEVKSIRRRDGLVLADESMQERD